MLFLTGCVPKEILPYYMRGAQPEGGEARQEDDDKTNDGVTMTYTLTYDGNGASGTPSAVTGLTNGQSVTLDDGSGMTKSGYSFSGWTDSGGTEYAGGS